MNWTVLACAPDMESSHAPGICAIGGAFHSPVATDIVWGYGPMLAGVHVPLGLAGVGGIGGVAHGITVEIKKIQQVGLRRIARCQVRGRADKPVFHKLDHRRMVHDRSHSSSHLRATCSSCWIAFFGPQFINSIVRSGW